MKNVNITMKKSFFVTAIIAGNFIFGQVGINNESPKATLDVTAKTTTPATAEGIIAPRLTGDQIQGKDAKYLAEQTGTIVYATSAVTGTPAGKTINITEAGYYYFDGLIWQKHGIEPWNVQGTNSTKASANDQNIYQMGKVAIGTGADINALPYAALTIQNNRIGVGSGAYDDVNIIAFHDSSDPSLQLVRSRAASPIQAGDLMGHVSFRPFGSQGVDNSTAIKGFFVSGTAAEINDPNSSVFKTNMGIYTSNKLAVTIDEDGDVGIGTGLLDGSPNDTPFTDTQNNKLSVKASNGVGTGFRLVDGSEGAGKVLVSDASGNASWALPASVPPLTIDSTPGVWTSLDVANPNGSNANMTYTGASAVVTIPGQYMISTRFISDKSPHGCSGILAFNLNKNSSTVFDRSTSAFSVQDPHMAPGTGGNDYIYTTQTAYLTAGTYYMFARTEGATGGACTYNNVRAGFAENSFTLTLLK